jgi:hypothetical protein
MAFEVRARGIAHDDRKPAWLHHCWWWQVDALRADSRFRELERDRGFLDFVAAISAAEAQELAATFAGDAMDHDRDRVIELNALLQDPDLGWVLVEINEWESGLGD